MVGIVPQSKRFDLAFDVLEGLLRHDRRYHLRVKGRTPEDYPWMRDRPEEMAYYEKQYGRIEQINHRHPGAVRFDGQGDDMPDWYRHIGIALSVSDFESFHLTVADGAASGALPALLAWPGSDLIYPTGWLSPSVAQTVSRILAAQELDSGREWVSDNFAEPAIVDRLLDVIAGVDKAP